MLGFHDNVLWAFGAIYGVLLIGTVAAYVMSARAADAGPTELVQRIRSWWVMITLVVVALALGPTGVILLFAFISYIALREYLSIIPSRKEDRLVIFLAYFVIPANTLLIWFDHYGIFVIFVPIYVFLLFPFVMALIGQVKHFLTFMGTLHWGLMTSVYNISYVAYLMMLPPEGNPNGGGAALVVFVLAVTQFNDVAQYVWGKLIGAPKIIPKVSPNKTWAGFLGGLATTTAVAFVVAPLLTPFNWWQSLLVGGVIGLAGFAGDVTISAVKRDLEIKDTSSLIPGHGGILDRIDSLTFTAPLFFHILYFYCY